MENKVLAQNIEQIKHYDFELFNKILMVDDEKSNIQLAQNENGEYNLIFEDNILHSTQGAIKEAQEIAQNFKDDNVIKIIYGLGLGYLADEASKKIQNGKIIIFEPNLEIIKFVLSIASLDVLLNKNVILCNEKKQLKNYILNFADEKTDISISFLNSYKKYMNDIKNILDIAQIAQGEIIGNKNTFIQKTPSVLQHALYNVRNIAKNPDILQLKNIYTGKTALILCAGPSLEENIEIIKQNQEKFVIFALNPTLKLLSKHEIKPDFIVAIENSDIFKQFDTINVEDSYLIAESYVYYKVSNLKTKKTFNYISNDDFFNFWIRDCFDIKESLKNFGTVSYTAFSSAVLMGFEKIILVGQDLAYKNNQCYSKDCQWGEMLCVFDEEEKKYKIVPKNKEKLIEAFQGENKTKEQAQKVLERRLKYLNQNIICVKSQDGKDIPSKTDYAVFIECFEKEAKILKENNPNLKLINSSSGAQINGFENIALAEAIKNSENIEKINLENYCAKYDKNYLILKMDELLAQLKKYQNLISEFILTNEKLLKELKNKKIFTANALKYMKLHKDILSKILKLKDEENIGFIVNTFLLICEKYFKINYFENEKIATETLSNMIESYKKIENRLNKCIRNLGNSKSFILE